MSNGPSVPPNPNHNARRYDLDRTVRLIIAIVVCVGVFYLVRYLSDVLLPLAISVLIAYLLNPLVTRVDKRIRNRTFSVCLILAGLGVGGMVAAMVVIPVMAHEWEGVSSIISSLRPKSPPVGVSQGLDTGPSEPGPDQASALKARWWGFKEKLDPTVRDWVDQGELALADVNWKEVVLSLSRKITPGLLGAISGLFSIVAGLTGVFLVLVYLVFLLFDFPAYSDHWHEFIPPEYRSNVVEFAREFTDAMSRYFRGQFLIATATGIMYIIGFWLIGLRLALPLGIFLGILNMVPYLQLVGVPIALLLAVVGAIESNPSPTPTTIMWALTWVGVIFLVAQLIQDWVLVPRIMGQSTGLRPVIMMVGLFIWGKLLGFLGVVLAIPLTCLLIACYRKLVLGQRLHPLSTPAPPPPMQVEIT